MTTATHLKELKEMSVIKDLIIERKVTNDDEY